MLQIDHILQFFQRAEQAHYYIHYNDINTECLSRHTCLNQAMQMLALATTVPHHHTVLLIARLITEDVLQPPHQHAALQ